MTTTEAPPEPESDADADGTADELTWAEEWEATILAADPLAADGITIHQRIIWLQGLIAGVGKHGFQQKDKYNFRRIDDVMNTVHIPLCKAGLYIKPIEKTLRIEEWTAWSNFNREFWVEMVYEITDPQGNVVEIPATGNAINSGDKGVAAAKSYAYKQMMGQLLSLPTDDPAMDVEHETHDTTRRAWWEQLGWASEAAATDTRADLMKRTRDLPEMEAGQWKKWAGVQETPADGMLYSPSKKRIAAQITPDMVTSWRLKLDELEELARARTEDKAEPFGTDDPEQQALEELGVHPPDKVDETDPAYDGQDVDPGTPIVSEGDPDLPREETAEEKADRIAREIAEEEAARR